MSSKIPVPVSARGTTSSSSSTGVGGGGIGLMSSVPSSPEHFCHHPHYVNHRSSPVRCNSGSSTPTNSSTLIHSSSVPTSSGMDNLRRSATPKQQQQPQPQQIPMSTNTTLSSGGGNGSGAGGGNSRPRFEAYMMTGDLIINLANTKSSDNLLFGQSSTSSTVSTDDRYNIFRHKRQRTTPNLHSGTLNVYKHEIFEGSTSLPSSPADPPSSKSSVEVAQQKPTENQEQNQVLKRGKTVSGDTNFLQSSSDATSPQGLPQDQQQPLSEHQQSQQQQQHFNVRLSKSEDQLMKGALATVCGFEDIDGANSQSNSVDTLLNNCNVVVTNSSSGSSIEASCNKKVDCTTSNSTSSSSNYSFSITNTTTTTTTTSSSPTNGELDNHNNQQQHHHHQHQQQQSHHQNHHQAPLKGGNHPRQQVQQHQMTATDDEELSLVTNNTISSIQSSSDSSGSYTAGTATAAATPTDGMMSYNGSPTKAISTATTGTQMDQTESSMSEGYSMLSSLSGGNFFNSNHSHSKHYHRQLNMQNSNCTTGSGVGGGGGGNGLTNNGSYYYKEKHTNSLSLSSSCNSSPIGSPQEEEEEEDDEEGEVNTCKHVKVDCDNASNQSGLDKSSGRSSRTTDILGDNETINFGGSGGGCGSSSSCVSPQRRSHRGSNEDNYVTSNNSGTSNNPLRYPSFITPSKDSSNRAAIDGDNLTESHNDTNLDDASSDVQSPPPPPLPNGPPPSSTSSSSENDSGSEDEIEMLSSSTYHHYSPPSKSVDMASACRLAKRLYNLEGFKKSDVSRHLSKNNEFSRAVAEEYLRYFDFVGDTLDCALRKFLEKFCLIGETQERERVLVHFSKRYLDCNQGGFKSSDAVHTLTCALMLLNTDLHGENVGRKMTCGEFIENLAGLNDGDNFPREVLRSLYQSIKNKPLEWATDEEVDLLCIEKKSSGNNGSTPLQPVSLLLGHNPFLDVPNPNVATEYKKGYIMRKSCFDSNGKRTPLGKRGWKMFYATLRDMVLYLHKDEHGFRKNQLYESLHNSIRIHHSLATKATDYTKKQFVFRLQTADGAEFLFQTSDARELQAWIDKINLVAASLSAPPLPSAVGSQTKKFQKPLLPVNHTKYNLRDQLMDHESRKLRLEQELEEHLTTHVDKASRRFLNEFAEKESYLQYELKRYQEYINLLRKKIAQTYGDQALESLKKNQNLVSCLTSNRSSSKPLTSVSIGEEMGDDNEEGGASIIKPKSFR